MREQAGQVEHPATLRLDGVGSAGGASGDLQQLLVVVASCEGCSLPY